MQAQSSVVKSSLRLTLAAVLMFGFGFAMVPLYDIFCEITGLNGKVQQSVITTDMQVDRSRLVKVQLIAANNAEMPWRFTSLQDEVELHPGDWKQVGFWAANVTDNYMVSQSVPSITPARAAQYIEKRECFCFQQQPLEAGESKQMNLVFTISPDMPDDIHTVSMVYTLFDASAYSEANKLVARVD